MELERDRDRVDVSGKSWCGGNYGKVRRKEVRVRGDEAG